MPTNEIIVSIIKPPHAKDTKRSSLKVSPAITVDAILERRDFVRELSILINLKSLNRLRCGSHVGSVRGKVIVDNEVPSITR